jgi:hypothetical protein
MSVKANAWAKAQVDLACAPYRVLGALADHINKDHQFCWPRIETLAIATGKSERTVKAAIRDLQDRGLVLVAPGPGAGRGKGRGASRYYLACCPKTGGARALPEIAAARAASRRLPAKGMAENGADLGFTECDPLHPVTGDPALTGCNPASLQGAKSGAPLIEEPESEPERENPDGFSLTPPAPADPVGATDRSKGSSGSGTITGADVAAAIEAYSAAAAWSGWTVAKGPHSKTRLAAVKARLRDVGVEGWAAQIALAARQPHLGGDNLRGWRMALDWFVTSGNWTKVAEGQYLPPDSRNVASPVAPLEDYSTEAGLAKLFTVGHKVTPATPHAFACRYRWMVGSWPKEFEDKAFLDTIPKAMVRALNAALRIKEQSKGGPAR